LTFFKGGVSVGMCHGWLVVEGRSRGGGGGRRPSRVSWLATGISELWRTLGH